MSYDILDAWIDEKALGDWPFDRWSIGSLPFREDYDYFYHPNLVSGVGALHYRLSSVFGLRSDRKAKLRRALNAAVEIVDSAIENSDADAFSCWESQELWLPVLDDTLNGSERPADMLAQSIDYVGVPDEASAREVSAALGLWLIGELQALPKNENWMHASILVQIAIATAEAEFYRGLDEAKKDEQRELTSRAQKANTARHAANRARVKEAESWWIDSGQNMSQAQASRDIAARFHVVEDVAKRWVRQFKQRAPSK